jgi:uncharacterized phage protein gp47/JayE
MSQPAVTITASGITIPAYSDWYSWLVSVYQSIFGADVYLGNDSQDGQLIGILAQTYTDLGNAVGSAYNAFSPATAQGNGLSSQVKINGLKRLVASNSTAILALVGQAGTTINNGIVSDTAGNQWALPASVTIGTSGTVSVTAICTIAGAVNAQAGAISQIQTPTQGWQSVTNPSAAVPGNPVENDAQLRVRQSISTAQPAQAIIEAIAASVGNVPGVTEYQIYENNSTTVDANGVPAGSIAPIVSGGDINAVGAAIALRQPPGCITYGTTSVQVIDPVGLPRTIRFFQLAQTPIYVALTIQPLAGYVASTGGQIQAAIAAAINANGIGTDVYPLRLLGAANLSGSAAINAASVILGYVPTQAQLDALSATYEITVFAVGTAPSPTGTGTIAIAFNVAASSSSADVALNVL